MGQVLLCTLPWDPTLPTCFSSDLMSQLGGFSSGSTGQWLNEMRDLLHCGEHLSMQSLGRKCILALTVNWNRTFAYTGPHSKLPHGPNKPPWHVPYPRFCEDPSQILHLPQFAISFLKHKLPHNLLPPYLLRDSLTGSKLLADCSKGGLV